MYGAEKPQGFVVEVEDYARRSGCFTERQPRLGLAVDGETPETLYRLGAPVERTKARLRMRFGAHRGGGDGAVFLYLLKSHGLFMGLRRDCRYHRT